MRRSCSYTTRVPTVFFITLLAFFAFLVLLAPATNANPLQKRELVVARAPQNRNSVAVPAPSSAPDPSPQPSPQPSPSPGPARNSNHANPSPQPSPSPTASPNSSPSPSPSPDPSPSPTPTNTPATNPAPTTSPVTQPAQQSSATPLATTPTTTPVAATVTASGTQPLTTAVTPSTSALPTVTATPVSSAAGSPAKNSGTVTISPSNPSPTTDAAAVATPVSASEKFWENKSAVAGTFTTVALIVVSICAAGGVLIHRHLQAKREDEEFFEKSWDPPDHDNGANDATSIEDVEFTNVTQPASASSYPDRRIHIGELGKIRGHRATPSKQHVIDDDGNLHDVMQPLTDASADRRLHLGKIRGHRATPSKQHAIDDSFDFSIGGGYFDDAQPRDAHTYGWTQPGSDPFASSPSTSTGFRDAERGVGYQDSHDSFYMAR